MRFAFEDYVLDPGRRELTRADEAVSMGPQVFDLLLHLVQNRERVVSKDDVLDAVWGRRIVSARTPPIPFRSRSPKFVGGQLAILILVECQKCLGRAGNLLGADLVVLVSVERGDDR